MLGLTQLNSTRRSVCANLRAEYCSHPCMHRTRGLSNVAGHTMAQARWIVTTTVLDVRYCFSMLAQEKPEELTWDESRGSGCLVDQGRDTSVPLSQVLITAPHQGLLSVTWWRPSSRTQPYSYHSTLQPSLGIPGQAVRSCACNFYLYGANESCTTSHIAHRNVRKSDAEACSVLHSSVACRQRGRTILTQEQQQGMLIARYEVPRYSGLLYTIRRLNRSSSSCCVQATGCLEMCPCYHGRTAQLPRM